MGTRLVFGRGRRDRVYVYTYIRVRVRVRTSEARDFGGSVRVATCLFLY